MDSTSIFLIREAFKRGAVRAKQESDSVGSRDIALARGEWRPDEPLRLVQYEGTKWLDYIGTQRATLRLFSSRVLDAFARARVTGWDTLPIELTDRSGALVPNYKLLVTLGRCGGVDNSRSVLVDRIVVGNPRGAKVWKGFYVEEQTWDGSDLFSPDGTALLFATEKVKGILDREGATNVDLVPLADVERPVLT